MHMTSRHGGYLIIASLIVLHMARTIHILDHSTLQLNWLWALETLTLIVSPVLLYQMTRSEQQLEQERLLFDDAMNSLPGIFYLFNQQGEMIRWNRSFETVSGYTHDEIAERHPLSYFEGEQATKIANAIQTAFVTGDVQVEALFTTKSGDKIPYLFSGRRVEFDDEKYVVGLGIDIGERQRAQKKALEAERLKLELQQAQHANALKSRFMTIVSHEFRTPLTSIQNSAEKLQRYWLKLTNDRREKHLQKIVTRTQKMAQLLDDFALAIQIDTAETPFEVDEFDVVLLLRELVHDLQDAKSDTHTVHIYDELDSPHIRQNRRLLSYVLRNLVDNAMKYSPPDSNITCRLVLHAGMLCIEVKDEGEGIALDEQEQIFDAYFRGKDTNHIHGSGLGLKIVRDGVTAMGGEVTLESEPGAGSCFRLRLPTNIPTPDAATSQPALQ